MSLIQATEHLKELQKLVGSDPEQLILKLAVFLEDQEILIQYWKQCYYGTVEQVNHMLNIPGPVSQFSSEAAVKMLADIQEMRNRGVTDYAAELQRIEDNAVDKVPVPTVQAGENPEVLPPDPTGSIEP